MKRKQATIDWRKSKSRQVLINALAPGGMLVDKKDWGPKQVWQLLKDHPVFLEEKLTYIQFRDRSGSSRFEESQEGSEFETHLKRI